jgi:hypothetical protein
MPPFQDGDDPAPLPEQGASAASDKPSRGSVFSGGGEWSQNNVSEYLSGMAQHVQSRAKEGGFAFVERFALF